MTEDKLRHVLGENARKVQFERRRLAVSLPMASGGALGLRFVIYLLTCDYLTDSKMLGRQQAD